MRQRKRWQYYCDFCKKNGGSKDHIKRHEKGCTSNVNLVCGVCGYHGINQEAVEFVKNVKTPNGMIFFDSSDPRNEKELKKLRDFFDDGCPACMLATVRQAEKQEGMSFLNFDYKKEHDAYWKERREKESHDFY